MRIHPLGRLQIRDYQCLLMMEVSSSPVSRSIYRTNSDTLLSVATTAINGAKNAALIAVSILALQDGELAARLDAFRAKQTADVLKAEL